MAPRDGRRREPPEPAGVTGTLRAVRRHTDYTLARRAVLRDLQRGSGRPPRRVRRPPRAAPGGPQRRRGRAGTVPGVRGPHVRYVSYVYGDDLRQANGRCISHPGELDRARRGARRVRPVRGRGLPRLPLEPPRPPGAARSAPRRSPRSVGTLAGQRLTRVPRHRLGRRRTGAVRTRAAQPADVRNPGCRVRCALPPGAVRALDGGGDRWLRRARLLPIPAQPAPGPSSKPATSDQRADVAVARATPLVMVTAYDAPSARAVDAAGVDMILVGDSVAMVVLGLRRHAPRHHRRHGAPHRGRRAHEAAGAGRRRPAVDELPRVTGRDRSQRRAASCARARAR